MRLESGADLSHLGERIARRARSGGSEGGGAAEAGDDAVAAEEGEHFEEARAFGTAGDGDADRMDEGAHADGLAVGAGLFGFGADKSFGGLDREGGERREGVGEGEQALARAGLVQALLDGRRVVGDVVREEIGAVAGQVGERAIR